LIAYSLVFNFAIYLVKINGKGRKKIPAVKIKPGENSRIIIKKLLGHKSSKTTEIYTYISTKKSFCNKEPA